MKVDLHLHSNHSDGNWSPQELVAHAISCGMTTIALTDHDTVSGIDEAISFAGTRVEIIPGIEINTMWIDAAGAGHDVHILGYFIDRTNSKLLDLLSRQRSARDQQVKRLIEILKEDGLDISEERVLEFSKGSPIGKMHVTQAIVVAGGAPDVSTAYAKYYDKKSKYFVRRKSASPFEAVEAINAAGGVASLAHPRAYTNVPQAVIEELASKGLGALEAYHSAQSSEDTEAVLKLAEKLSLRVTGGSDCHGPFEEFASLMGSVPVPPDVVTNLRSRVQGATII